MNHTAIRFYEWDVVDNRVLSTGTTLGTCTCNITSCDSISTVGPASTNVDGGEGRNVVEGI